MTSRLPDLGAPTRVRLPQSTVLGFVARQRHRFMMIEATGGPRNQTFVLRPGIDLSRYHKAERRLFDFTAGMERYRGIVNNELSGGTSYPVLATLLGIGGGFITSGGSTAFGVILTALDLTRQAQSILARQGDELWQMEVIGRGSNGRLVHVEYFVLWDPYRREASVPSNWVIHEERRQVTI